MIKYGAAGYVCCAGLSDAICATACVWLRILPIHRGHSYQAIMRGVGYSAIRSAISSCKSEVIALNDYRVMIAENKVEKYRTPSAVTEILADYFGKVEFYCLNSFGDAVDDCGNRVFGYDGGIGASK